MNRILVIDDDQDIIVLLKRFLTKHGYTVETALSGASGEKAIDAFKPDLVMCDYRLDDMDGITLLARIKEKNAELPVIIMTGYSDLRTAVKVIRLGALDYITKPFIPDEILLTVSQALAAEKPKAKQTKSVSNTNYIFTNSPHSKNLKQQIELVAPTNYSVIIYGESGTGKEGVAQLIHENSTRAGKAFVAMDCGAISKELAASELFGHEKGAFTGALNQKIGHFEMAEGGTLFLDEVANLPYDIQTLLLRVLQEKKLRRLGSNKEIHTDVRIVVASNERLSEAIKLGKFREDLYHRLNEFSIDVLPLSKRKEDIKVFAKKFLEDISKELNKDFVEFDAEIQNVFLNYPWPGNVRELKNVVKRVALLAGKGNAELRHLPFEILNHQQIEFEADEPVKTPVVNSSAAGHESSDGPGENSKVHLKQAARNGEYDVIVAALAKSDYNRSKAADLLGIDRKTLYNKMKQMDLLEK